MNNLKGLPVSSQFRAYAKLNWDLFVFPADRLVGLHPIDSLVITIDLYDDIFLEISEGNNINVACKVAPGKNNLVWKAIDEFLRFTDKSLSVKVSIEKNIPDGAGLGGGSSDAMATIIELNRLTEANLTNHELIKIGHKIGSDLSLFLSKGWMRATGFGEKVEMLKFMPKRFLIVKPPFLLQTPTVYKKWDEYKQETKLPDIVSRLSKPFNSLLHPASKLQPEIENIISVLQNFEGLKNVSMTGSGSAIFAEITSSTLSQQKLIGENNWDFFEVETICS